LHCTAYEPAWSFRTTKRARNADAHPRTRCRVLAQACLDLETQPSGHVRRLESGGNLRVVEPRPPMAWPGNSEN
jgi:hypothetical protein